MKIIILDTETTGLLKPKLVPLDQQPKIIEFGALSIEGKTKKKINQLLDPEMTLPEIITQITGITNADLVGQPTFETFLPKIIKFFKGTNILIAHNAPFDTGMLRNELARLDYDQFPWPEHIICTVQEYKTSIGKWPKLEELYANVMGKPLNQTHRAMDDCEALYEILVVDNFFAKIICEVCGGMLPCDCNIPKGAI